MKAKIKREWEASVDGKLIPCKFEEDVIQEFNEIL